MASGTGGKEDEEGSPPDSPRDGRLPVPQESESRSPGCWNTMTAMRAEPSLNHRSGVDDGTALAGAPQETPGAGTLWITLLDLFADVSRLLRFLSSFRAPIEWRSACEDCERFAKRRDCIICRCYRYLRSLIFNLAVIILGGLFLGVRDGRRHGRRRRCSTMPWDIPPKLAVLWGVCWMFRGQDDQLDETSWEAEHSLTGQWGTLPAGSWNALPPAASPPALEADVSLLDWDNLLDYSTPTFPQQFGAWPLGEQVAGGAGLPTTSLALDTMGGSSFGIQSALGDTVASPGLGTQYVTPGPLTSLDALAPVLEIPVSRPAGTQPKILEGNGPLVTATAGASPPPTSSGSEEQTVVADVNGPPELRCDYPGCEKTFTSADSHRKHSARHSLRFSCSMCDWKFGTRSDLERHESTVHSQGASRLWYCTDPSCRRRGRGFSRRDNFRKHMREVHNQADAASDAPSLPSSQPPSGQKRKRGGGDEVAGGGDGRGNGAGIQVLERENQRLRDEIETLRRDREAEAQRHRQAVAEGARELLACRETQTKLVGMLDRVLSRDAS